MDAHRPDAARRATGPISPQGKERSSLNALRHGLCSPKVVIPGEDPQQWEAFLREHVVYFAPVGLPEVELVERYAACQWRLRRAAAYEADVTALGIEQAETDAVTGAADCAPASEPGRIEEMTARLNERNGYRTRYAPALELFERLPGLADRATLDAEAVARALEHAHSCVSLWQKEVPDGNDPRFRAFFAADAGERVTVGRLRSGLAWLAARAGQEAKAFREGVTAALKGALERCRAEAEALAHELAGLAAGLAGRVEALRRRRALPLDILATLDRHEAHLERQARRALEALRELQDRRRRREAAPGGTEAPGGVRSAVPAETAPLPEALPTGADAGRVRSAVSPAPAPAAAAPTAAVGGVHFAVPVGGDRPAAARPEPTPSGGASRPPDPGRPALRSVGPAGGAGRESS